MDGFSFTTQEDVDGYMKGGEFHPFGNPYLRFNEDTGYIEALNDLGVWTNIYKTKTLPIESTHYLFKGGEFKNELTGYKSAGTKGPNDADYYTQNRYPETSLSSSGLFIRISEGNWHFGTVMFSPKISADSLSGYTSLKIKISSSYAVSSKLGNIYFCFTQTDPSTAAWNAISGCSIPLTSVSSDLIISVPVPKVDAYIAISMYCSNDRWPYCTIEEMWLE